jgi:hypothetical protein
MRLTSRRGIALAAVIGLIGALGAAGPALADTPAQGAFVIGDGNATVFSQVTFWGAQWWMDNSLSGGLAPASFKGFADTATNPPTCGQPWTTSPGDSSQPPPAVAPFTLVNVIVASNVTKQGSTISGDTAAVALVETDPGYAPDPGHAGTGMVMSIIPCLPVGPT